MEVNELSARQQCTRVGKRASAVESIAMSLFREPWFYCLMGFIAGITSFVIGVTGRVSGRAGRPIVSVKSVPLRIAFLFISVAIFAFLIWTIKHEIAAAIQYFGQPS